MIRFLNQRFAGGIPRRARRSRHFSSSLDCYESRTLLSGVAVFPQPAEAVGISGEVGTAATPPENFAGLWNIFTPDGPGTAIILQSGADLQVSFNFGPISLPAQGKVKGDTAKIKIKTTVMSYKVKGKVVTTLNGPNSMEGNVKLKVVGVEKVKLPLIGTRV